MSGHILYVDDKLDAQERLKQIFPHQQLKVADPGQLSEPAKIRELLRGVSLVLMDYDLHEDDSFEGATSILDGRECLERIKAVVRKDQQPRQFSIAIYTGKYPRLAEELDCDEPWEVADRLAIDWAFEKGTSGSIETMLQSLHRAADAVAAVPWRDDARARLRDVLAMPSDEHAVWAGLAFEHLEALRPPIQSLVKDGDGMKFLSFLLHVVLPFPSCLIDIRDVAVRLRVTPKSLEEALAHKPDSRLARELRGTAYSGVLHDFVGQRYWRAGVDAVCWSISEGRSIALAETFEMITGWADHDLQRLEYRNPVVAIDDSYRRSDIVDISETVQIQPDTWPAEIEPPYIKISDVIGMPSIEALVSPRDRERIEETR